MFMVVFQIEKRMPPVGGPAMFGLSGAESLHGISGGRQRP